MSINDTGLADAVKIIMHTSYMYTKDHPQRRLQDMDLALEDVDVRHLRDLGPMEYGAEVQGTGFVASDFAVGNEVEVWLHRSWWRGKVIYITRAGDLTVRMVGARDGTSGLKPSQCRLA